MQFSKWHALGNSYVVVERGDRPLTAADAAALCDAERGAGSDGVLEVVAADGASLEILIWNPDGSLAEMSGNGTRIAARWLAARTGADRVDVRVGARRVVARMLDDVLVETDVGDVSVGEPETVAAGDEEIELTTASVGNPHAVVRREAPTRADLLLLGPLLETHTRFPERTNVQLVRPDDAHAVTALVWERGAGETSASGSSAVAVAAVAVARGWCESPVTVRMPGGDLVVSIAGGRATQTGPAELLGTGDWQPEPEGGSHE